jgi:Flp pilus assembly protein TadD
MQEVSPAKQLYPSHASPRPPLQKAKKQFRHEEPDLLISRGVDLMARRNYSEAEVIFREVLKKDPNNPLALNNLAAIMVVKKRFDRADMLLNQALPKAKGYMVDTNRIVSIGNICHAFKPAAGGTKQQELEPLLKMNIEMIKNYFLNLTRPVR